jgi:hypothetical protein
VVLEHSSGTIDGSNSLSAYYGFGTSTGAEAYFHQMGMYSLDSGGTYPGNLRAGVGALMTVGGVDYGIEITGVATETSTTVGDRVCVKFAPATDLTVHGMAFSVDLFYATVQIRAGIWDAAGAIVHSMDLHMNSTDYPAYLLFGESVALTADTTYYFGLECINSSSFVGLRSILVEGNTVDVQSPNDPRPVSAWNGSAWGDIANTSSPLSLLLGA